MLLMERKNPQTRNAIHKLQWNVNAVLPDLLTENGAVTRNENATTDSREYDSYWSAEGCPARQSISHFLRNPKVCYRTHNSMWLVSTLSQINPIPIVMLYFFMIDVVIGLALLPTSSYPRTPLLSYFSIKFWRAFLIAPVNATWSGGIYSLSLHHPISTNHDVHHYAVFSSYQLIRRFHIKIFSSATCSQTRSLLLRQ